MRIGVLWFANSNARYRALDPMNALRERGHEVLWPDLRTGRQPLARLVSCDVVHVYRDWTDEILSMVQELRRRGVPVVYDNDDDYTLIHRESTTYRDVGGFRGEAIHRRILRMARHATIVTTTTEALARRYVASGLERVEVIPNMINPLIRRPTNRHAGLRIGWVAGLEHRHDAKALGIAEALSSIVATRTDVSVECVGIDLALRERYAHTELVEFEDIPRVMARWDIGIAPLADIPFNHMRSDIKVKEYAACGIPWLASPVGPYVGLGEQQGGRLVAAGAWEAEIRRLLDSRRDRRRLSRRGRRWAKRNTIAATAERWERVLMDAVALSGADTGRAAPGASTLDVSRLLLAEPDS